MRRDCRHSCGLQAEGLSSFKPLQPMNSRDVLTHIFWGTPPLLQLATSVIMRRRKLERDFPFFFTYTLALVVQSALLYWLSHVPQPDGFSYFFWRWTAELVDGVLKLAVVNEIYAHIFERYPALRGLGEILFRWILAVMVIIASVVAALAEGEDGARIVRGVLAFDLSMTIIIGGLLFSLFLFASYLGLKWRDFAFGVALGLALFATVGLAGVVTRIHWGPIADSSYALVRSAAYNCSVLIWLVYCLRRAPAGATVTSFPVNNLERWNQALLELRQQ
jgi:hypothetical protein